MARSHKNAAKRNAQRRYSASATVKVSWGDDLADFNRALHSAQRKLNRELRPVLDDVGQGVAARARENARSKGLQKSGRLIEFIDSEVTTSFRGITALVGDTAVNPKDNYPYPGRLEYGDLDRPFLQPALAWAEGHGLRALRELAARVVSTIVK